MRTLLAGVIGHVDHGKTALVKALTGIDTDRLKEERARGLSIVLGFSHLATAGGGEIDLIDMPGHERFVRTMISGATGIEAALLVVAANEGPRPQTLEHVEIARLIGVRRAVIAITKCDLTSAEEARSAAAASCALAEAHGLEETQPVLTSAVTGEGLDVLAGRLADLLEDEGARLDHGFFYLPLDRVFTAPGFGTVVTGTLRRGPLSVGDEVEVVPGGLRARLRGLQVHNRTAEAVGPGRRVAVNLRGVERAELRRGQALTTPGALRLGPWLDASLMLLESVPRPLQNNQVGRLLIGTLETCARVRLLDRDQLLPGESALVQLRCAEEVAVPAREPFILRAASPARTIGGGRIVARAPHRRRRLNAGVLQHVRALAQDDSAAVVAAQLRRAGYRGCRLDELTRVTGFGAARLGGWLEEAQALVFQDGTVMHRTICADLEDALLARTDGFHRQHPRQPGISKEQLRRILPEGLPVAVVSESLGRLAARGQIVQEDGVVRRTGFRPARGHGEDADDLAPRIEHAFRAGGLAPPDVKEVIGHDPRRRKTVRDLVRSGILVPTLDRVQKREILFHKDAIVQARDAIEQRLSGEDGFLVRDAGGILGISRKYSIPLLEYLDSVHCTRRIGDRRVVVRRQSRLSPGTALQDGGS